MEARKSCEQSIAFVEAVVSSNVFMFIAGAIMKREAFSTLHLPCCDFD